MSNVIVKVENPVDGNEIVMAKGKVERIVIKEAPVTAKNTEYGVTHTASIVVGDTWINFISLNITEGYEPSVDINSGTKDSPKYEKLAVGDEVRIVVSETVKDGKTYYNAKKSGIKITKKTETPVNAQGRPATQEAKTNTFKPKDMTGVETGHALNGALNLVRGVEGLDYDDETISVLAKKVHDTSVKLKEKVSKANPDMDKGDVGAMVGHAVLNAARDVEAVEQLEEHAEYILSLVPNISEYVKASKKPVEKVEEKKAPAPKKTTPKKKPVIKEEVVEPTEPVEEKTEVSGEDEDDIPF